MLAAEESAQVEESQAVGRETDQAVEQKTVEREAVEREKGKPEADAQAEIYNGPGLPDLDKAMCEKVTAEGIRDLNQVIQLAQSALDQGLCSEDSDFGQRLLSGTLMERATVLIRVINTRSIVDQRVQQVRKLVVSDLRRVLAKDNPPADAYLMLGRLMALPGGDPHEAVRLLTEYLAATALSDPQRAEALVTRAQVQTSEAKALADFDEAIRLLPDNSNYRLARALFHRVHKRLDQALADVATVMEKMPDEANGLILQGEILREQGKLEEAIASFDLATELTPQAPGPYQNRGEIYRLQNKYQQAIEQFGKVLETQPGVLITLVHRAEAYLHAGNPQLALDDVDMVLKKQPGLVAAHRIRAEVFANLGRLSEAIDEMAQIAKAMPEQAELKMQLALYYLVNKEPREAIAAYTSVLEFDPKNFLALRSRADICLSLGEHVQAAADFKYALAIKPEDTLLLNNYAWLQATSPLDEVRDCKQAIEMATKACTLTEYKQSHILSTLAAAYAEAGDFASAVKWSQQAVNMAATDRSPTDRNSPDGQASQGEVQGESDEEVRNQLAAELASYRLGKPWREVQSMEPDQPQSSPETQPQEAPSPTDSPDVAQSPGQSVDAN